MSAVIAVSVKDMSMQSKPSYAANNFEMIDNYRIGDLIGVWGKITKKGEISDLRSVVSFAGNWVTVDLFVDNIYN